METTKKFKDSMTMTCIIKSFCVGAPSVLALAYGAYMFFVTWFVDSVLFAMAGMDKGVFSHLGVGFLFLFIIPVVYSAVLIHLFFISCMRDMKKAKKHLLFMFFEELFCMVISYIAFTYCGTEDVVLIIFQFCFIASSVAGFVLNIWNMRLAVKAE